MIRNGELRMSEVKRVGRKYWWVLPLTIIGGLSIALGVAAILPPKYTSQTVILVDQPTVSPDIVKPVVTEATNQRLASLQQEILSRSRLQPIIERFGLYQQKRGTTHMEDLVLSLQNAITVTPLEPMAGTGNRQQAFPGFQVGVTFDDPRTAQRICAEITTMFMEQNAKYMDDKSNSTTRFLSQQLDEAKRRLDEQDAKLAEFKKHYIGSLPEQAQTNLSLLSGMNSQFEALSQALSRAQQDKAFNESLLSSQLANWKLASEGNGNPETLENQLAGLQDLLSTLQSRYTPEHPDVIKTKSQIEEIRKQMAEAPDSNSNSSPVRSFKTEPPQIQQLRARMRQDDLNLEELTKRQAQVQKHITILEGRLQLSPAVEQQFKELTRNHQTALDFYNDLMKKHDQSTMAQDLNHQQQGEHFNVLDPPSLPLTPSFPKKLKFAGGGFAVGLCLGLGILYLLAALDKAMHTELDVEVCLKLPVLTAIPILDQKGKAVGRNGSLDKKLDLVGTRS
jgi:polysaccharide chain length determinant protein (PEP-CTERM system associated)